MFFSGRPARWVVYSNRAAHAQGLVQAGLREQNGVPGVTDTVGEFLPYGSQSRKR